MKRVRLSPKAQLIARGVKPKKSFGQNFLTDEGALERIADLIASGTPKESFCVEYGPGTGALTAYLLDTDMKLHAVERDRDLVPVLADRFADDIDNGKFILHEANASTFEAPDAPNPYTLCGNLPYHLTSGLLSDAVSNVRVQHAVFLIQKEVAQRVASDHGNKVYGTLSVIVQRVFNTSLAFEVPKGAFWPAPDVDGGVISLRRRETPIGGAELRDDIFRKVVRTAFQTRRKTLRNSLKSLCSPEHFTTADIDAGRRAETLSVEEFVRLALVFQEMSDDA